VDIDDPDDPLIRPFLVTGGRTRPVVPDLSVETLVSAQPGARYRPLTAEARRLVELCDQPRSVAELAALLRLPLGVTRVLIGDLAAERILECHAPAVHTVPLLERIRDLVQKL
jgi:hypothetical protein